MNNGTNSTNPNQLQNDFVDGYTIMRSVSGSSPAYSQLHQSILAGIFPTSSSLSYPQPQPATGSTVMPASAASSSLYHPQSQPAAGSIFLPASATSSSLYQPQSQPHPATGSSFLPASATFPSLYHPQSQPHPATGSSFLPASATSSSLYHPQSQPQPASGSTLLSASTRPSWLTSRPSSHATVSSRTAAYVRAVQKIHEKASKRPGQPTQADVAKMLSKAKKKVTFSSDVFTSTILPSTSQTSHSSTSITFPPTYIPPIISPPTVTAAVPHPPNWLANLDDTLMSLNNLFKKFKISNDTAEFQTIKNMLHPIQVTSIEQIVNHELWDRFVKARVDMLRSKTDDNYILRKLGLTDLALARRVHMSVNFTKDPLLVPYSDNMVLLFHCTRSQSNLNSILSQGLDERLSSVSGGRLGKGIYFSDDPNKALQYDGTGSIFIFAVLLGDCISVDNFQNRNELVREPEKVQQQKRNHHDQFFDSIVARPVGYNEYVIYNRYQCCPIYEIRHDRGVAQPRGQLSHYNLATQKLPPLAWIPTRTGCAMPIQDQTTNWPFFAVDIFNAMGVTPPTDDDDEIPDAQEVDNNTAEPSIDDNLAELINFGFNDEARNRKTLAKFNNNLQQAVNYLLDNGTVEDDGVEEIFVVQETSAAATAASSSANSLPSSSRVKDEQPSIIIIDDDDESEATESDQRLVPNNVTSTVTSESSETDLPAEIVEWALDKLDKKYGATEDIDQNNGATSTQEIDQKNTATQKIDQNNDATQEIDQNKVEPQLEDCPICCNDYEPFVTDPSPWHLLKCSHKLCIACYSKILTTRWTMSSVQHTFVKCPFCQGTSGIEVGTCPDMQMKVSTQPISCDGYHPSPTFVINYTGNHFARTAYLPDTVKGQEALRLLKIAFDRRLCFTVGTSNTTGCSNVIVWNIHHKTAIRGGVSTHGYPDPGYLDRLMWELKAFGIE